ncbi:MAG: family 10 glycosylhydrolase, partial [Spirosomataceae bacterium]
MKKTFILYQIPLLFLSVYFSVGGCSKKTALRVEKPIESPKREFRAAWVATVDNIDWPSNKNLTTNAQKVEFVRILDRHQELGINAAMVQVRAAADAFYARSTEPWSEWLTGVQGKSPDPYYDP